MAKNGSGTHNSMKITIRPFKEEDADDFFKYAGDEGVTRFTGWDTFNSKEEALSYIKNYCIPHPYCRSICSDDHSIGFMMITPERGDRNKCRAVLGYALAAEYWGQGITPKAVRMAILEGFREFPDVVRIQAFVEIENKASQRVLDKLGFLKECVFRECTYTKGQLKDLVVYSLLSTDPIPQIT